jgi:hypothetical protein
MTQQLRQSGLLNANQRVMGFSSGQVFTGPTSSTSSAGGTGTSSLPGDDTSATSEQDRRQREK